MTTLSALAAICAGLSLWWWWPTPVRRGPLARPPAAARWTSVRTVGRRRGRSAATQARDVGVLCSALASELRAGQPPGAAWDAVLSAWSGPLPGRCVANTDVVTILTRWGQVKDGEA